MKKVRIGSMAKIQFEKQKHIIVEINDVELYLSNSEQIDLYKLLDKVCEGLMKDGRHYKNYEVIVKAVDTSGLVE